ncbi:MAG: hypothetical protein BMS9Abin37_1763 [Acidobacteriota bacterium]|nr:MAG: hypothetical protein BMS9Abin37_1763 [Acidobacteriota bacterium]
MNQLSRPCAVLCVLACAVTLEAREKWHEVHSPNFVVISNAAEGRTKDVAARMEQFRYALSRLLPSLNFATEVPTQVYAFRDFDSFESFLPRTNDGVTPPAGYFREGPYKNVIALDLSAGRAAYERVVFHEYVHLLLSLGFRDYPLWFEEGMAEFYSSTRLHDDSAELGVVEEHHRRVLATRPLLPLAELLTAADDWPLSASAHDSALFYAQSWGLVHYLVAGSGTEGHRKLASYLGRLSRDEDRLEAFHAAFEMSPEAMEDALTAYVEAGDFPHYEFSLSEMDWKDGFETKVLTMAEVQHRWGELFLFTGRAREAEVCLEEACRLNPNMAAAWKTRGIAALMNGRHEEALAYLKRAVSGDGVSPTGLYLYARALLRNHSGQWVESVPDELAEEAERALTRSLELKPAQSETARLLAFVYLVRGVRLEEATELVEGALTMTPGRPSLLYLYGQILARRGDYQSAREALGQMRADATEPSLQKARDELLARLDTAERAR